MKDPDVFYSTLTADSAYVFNHIIGYDDGYWDEQKQEWIPGTGGGSMDVFNLTFAKQDK